MKPKVREWCLRLWGTFKNRDAEVEEELRFHLEMAEQDALRRGASDREARLRTGQPAQAADSLRDQWTIGWLRDLFADTRYGARILGRSPLFTAAAIGSLALGIGANTAIFSLMDALLMRFLPVHNPSELVELTLVEQGRRVNSFSYPPIAALAAQKDIFSGVAGCTTYSFDFTSGAETMRLPGAWVTGEFYRMLGVEPFAGRLIAPRDDRPGATPVAVLSYAYWRSRFAGDFGVIGRTIQIENQPVLVIGISPRGFDGAIVGSTANLTLPLGVLPQLFPERSRMLDATAQWMRVLARPRTGVSTAQAKARLGVVWPRIAPLATTPRMNRSRRDALLNSSIDLMPGGSGFSDLRSQFRRPLGVLLAITALVLLIACANFANLLLARGTTRVREIALRFAIGASRARVIRQLLTESVLLSAAGAALGLLFAGIAGRSLLAVLSTGGFNPIALDLRPDARVLLFTTMIALSTGILFGLVPALRATATGPAAALKGGSGIAPRTRTRLLPALVVSQVALSLTLLIGAGLFVRTFQNLLERDPGFRSEGVLLVEVDARPAGFKGSRLTKFYEQILNSFRQIPGVISASVSVYTPLNGGDWSDSVAINGQMTSESVHLNLTGPHYFETLGTPLVLGRDFGEADRAGAPYTAIVNEAFVRKYLPDGHPLGQQIAIAFPARATLEVVGVVKSTVAQSLREEAPPFLYLSYFQFEEQITSSTFEIRAQGRLATTAAVVHDQLRARFAGTSAQTREQTLTEQVARTLVQERTLATLGGAFGVLALILAAVGLYGLLAYLVARSTNEIGIRMALGAQRGELLALVLKGALRLLAFGVAMGVPVAWIATRWIGAMLFGLRGTDPAITALAAALLAATALAAALIPALRAARVDPLTALRYE